VVKQAGVTPVIAHYTPIPHTPMWDDAVAASRYDLESDPIFYQQRHLSLPERALFLGGADAPEASGRRNLIVNRFLPMVSASDELTALPPGSIS
jgi:hypothetical protein